MHTDQLNFLLNIHDKYPSFFNNCRVLEIGSYNVNGSVRQLFNNCNYIGLDVLPGKDVDIVCRGKDYKSEYLFDTVISSECFEHDEDWHFTFENMIKLCKANGLILFTCATIGRPEHGTKRTSPTDSLTSQLNDYYMNLTKDDFLKYFNFNELFIQFTFSNKANDLYFYGIKK